jgi:hypothetical protein
VQNAFIESFNGRLGDEPRNETLFRSLQHARVAPDKWRTDYNTERLHSSLDWQTPTAFAGEPGSVGAGRALSQSEGVAPCPVVSDTENTFNHTPTLWFPRWLRSWEHVKGISMAGVMFTIEPPDGAPSLFEVGFQLSCRPGRFGSIL